MSEKIRTMADLRGIIAQHDLNLHDLWAMAIIMSDTFQGMIKFTGARVVLHVKHPPAPKKKPRAIKNPIVGVPAP